MNAFHQQYIALPPILRAVKREALSTKFPELNSDLKSFIWQMVNSGTPETRYEILLVGIHISGTNTKVSEVWGQILILMKNAKYIYRSQHSLHLKMKWITSKTQRYPEYEKNNFIAMLDSIFMKNWQKRNGEIFLFKNTLKSKLRTTWFPHLLKMKQIKI